MSNDNHQQSVGGQGATDGLSGTEHSGTEGADSGQGVNKGADKGQHGKSDTPAKKEDKKNQPTP